LQHLVVSSLDKCEIDSRKQLMQNIILAGGTTMLKGFSERLKNEIATL
jgi:actin-related protein